MGRGRRRGRERRFLSANEWLCDEYGWHHHKLTPTRPVSRDEAVFRQKCDHRAEMMREITEAFPEFEPRSLADYGINRLRSAYVNALMKLGEGYKGHIVNAVRRGLLQTKPCDGGVRIVGIPGWVWIDGVRHNRYLRTHVYWETVK